MPGHGMLSYLIDGCMVPHLGLKDRTKDGAKAPQSPVIIPFSTVGFHRKAIAKMAKNTSKLLLSEMKIGNGSKRG